MPSPGPRRPAPSPRVLLVVSAVATAVLPHVPILRMLAWPLVWVGTLAHELGHGVAGMVVGRRFDRFVVRMDGSGVAHTAGTTAGWELAFTAAGGLVGPALVALVCLALSRGEATARLGLIAVGAGLLVSAPWLVGSLFTAALVLAVAAGTLWLGWWGRQAARLGLAFLGVQLAVQVWTRSDYLFVAHTTRGSRSDVGAIADALGGPYWLWGGIMGTLSLAVLAVGLWVAWGPAAGEERPG